MIPKVIHYCWFGRQAMPSLAVKCIESWKRYLPDYEIKEWNEDNFDVNIIPYTKEAYSSKKYAFVSDYARFWILYKYGGIYFDTDVEVIRPMDDIIKKGPFMGCETDYSEKKATAIAVAPGLGLGVNPGHGRGVNPGRGRFKEILEYYAGLHFIKENGQYNLNTVVNYITSILYEHGLKNVKEVQECAGVWVYPKEYFCPIHGANINFTSNTRTVHHYMASWKKLSLRKKIVSILHKIIYKYQIIKILMCK